MGISDLFKGKEEMDLTSGDIARPLFFLSLPIVITNLLQTAYNLADTFWLARVNEVALAAITFGFPMVFLLISLGMGLSVAGSVLVAQHTGAEEPREAEYAASQTVMFAFVASTILGIVGYFAVDTVLWLLGARGAVLREATQYMEVIALGMPFLFGFFVFISLMRGYGDTVTPMLVMFGTVVLNVVIDPLFIFGFGPIPDGLGVQGAAIATVISRFVATAVGLAIMFRGKRGVQIRLSQMAPDLQFFKKMLGIGVPASIEGTGRSVSVNLMLVVVAIFSSGFVAAFGVGIRIFSVIFLPAIAVGQGVETMVGQNIGAGKYDRAQRTADTAAVGMFGALSVLAVIVFAFTEPIVAPLSPNQEVTDIAVTFLRVVAPTFGFIGVMRSYNGAFRGSGKTMVSAAIAITMLGIIRLPIAYVLSRGIDPVASLLPFATGQAGIWTSFVVSNTLGAVIAFAWFRRGTWRGADVRGQGAVDASPTDD
ncbi:MATE family efflux transporter [Haloarchaeobius amylolyticus]|uniref:MATE family efflux transporter n=1 Tax=Haloarchaeobius amylolyticus TaxID=1198296 RepID=UPI0022711D9E|nr:MATE family efflux transporter [Haloarchaeobius amylolyticus]